LENREAAVRFICASPAAPDGANVEVKPIDPSANPYVSTAVLLEAARVGISAGMPLAPAVSVNPASLGDRAPAVLPTDVADQLVRLGRSDVAARALGPEIIEAVTAVRGREDETYRDRPLDEVAERLRYAWTN